MQNRKGGYEIRNAFFKGLIGDRDITFIEGTRNKHHVQSINQL